MTTPVHNIIQSEPPNWLLPITVALLIRKPDVVALVHSRDFSKNSGFPHP